VVSVFFPTLPRFFLFSLRPLGLPAFFRRGVVSPLGILLSLENTLQFTVFFPMRRKQLLFFAEDMPGFLLFIFFSFPSELVLTLFFSFFWTGLSAGRTGLFLFFWLFWEGKEKGK